MKIYFKDRQTGEKKEEKIHYEGWLRFLYGNGLGRICVQGIARLPIFSSFAGWWQRQPFTRRFVAPFVKKYEVDLSEYEVPESGFGSFDAFFSRKLKPGIRSLAPGLIVPADGRYLVYPRLDKADLFRVKGVSLSLETLLRDPIQAYDYQEASMVIARLAPSDYHRFHFPIECIAGEPKAIAGPLYSVNPLIGLASSAHTLFENKRMITPLKTSEYGTLLFIEIGATAVGTIHQTFIAGNLYQKGEEKGYFSFGGSCVILLFPPKTIEFAEDLVHTSAEKLETLCRFGQPLERTR